MRLVFLVAAMAAWTGCEPLPCTDGTIVLALSFTNGAEQADGLDLSLTVDQNPPQLRHVTRTPGRTSDTLALAFSTAYPEGHLISLSAVALAGAPPLASGTDQLTAPRGCAMRTLALTGGGAVACPTDVAFCDDFESGAIDASRWSNNTTMNGTRAVDTSKPHRGQYSLHLATNAVAAGGTFEVTLGETRTFAAGTSSYSRGWFWLSPTTPASGDVAALIDVTQASSPFNGERVHLQNGALAVASDIAGNDVHSTTPSVPIGQWVCIEYQVSTATPNQINVWMNDAPVPMLSLMQATAGAPPIGQVAFGLESYASSNAVPALEAWIDDVIVDTRRIGCAK